MLLQWIKNFFAEKKLIAMVEMELVTTNADDEELYTDTYMAYCFQQGTRRKAALVGPRTCRGYLKREHPRWTHCIEPWLKYGYTGNLKKYMVVS